MIGNFLAHKTGSVGPSERITRSSLNKKALFIMASTKVNQFVRLIDMMLKTSFYAYDIIHIDV